MIDGADIRTGVTAIVHDVLIGASPDGRRTLPAGLAVFNGFGKMTGSTQVSEFGVIETPVLLTGTLSVPIPRQDDEPAEPDPAGPPEAGSCVIVLATDIALGPGELQRTAKRAFAGMARVGADFSGRSGDYALAVSTASERAAEWPAGLVPAKDLDLIFQAAIEATEEAILNSVLMAVTTTGYRGHVSRAVPIDHVRALVAAGRSQ